MTIDTMPGCCPPPSALGSQVAIIEGDLALLDAMIDRYGCDSVAAAGANEFLRGACDELRDVINASDMPQFMKDEYLARVNALEAELTLPVDPACQDEVAASTYGHCCCADGAAAVQDAAAPEQEAASEAGGAEAAGGEGGAEEAGGGGGAEEAGGGGGGGAEEAGGGGGGGDAQSSVEDSMMANANITRDPEEEEGGGGGGGGGGGNIMLRIAKKMGNAQDKLLQSALKALDAMELAQSADGKPTDKFATHQSEFTAYMQLFTITANATATSLKSLGEGCTAVARKQ